MGNLVRATFVGSSNNVWPWSYDKCDPITQSQQKFSHCNRVVHFDMHSAQGRGAPEVDVFEVMPGARGSLINTETQRPYMSSSLQVKEREIAVMYMCVCGSYAVMYEELFCKCSRSLTTTTT